MTDKEQCKKAVLKILRELESLLEEAEKNGIPRSEFESELIFTSVDSFAKAISTDSHYSKSTARDAIKELEDERQISRRLSGFFELTKSKKIEKIVKTNLYVTPLPVLNQNNGNHYIETSDNAAPFLANLFNNYTARNDKRFYSIAHNLLLMLDLEISDTQNFIQKKEFDLESFIKGFGIFIQDYDTLIYPVDGLTYNDILESDFNTSLLLRHQEEQFQCDQNGNLTTPRRVKKPKPIE